jgi:hypothetical protein
MEPVATVKSNRAVAVNAGSATLVEIAGQLQELIAAIDRRLPQEQRSADAAITDVAARLRIEAVKRLREIEYEIASRES